MPGRKNSAIRRIQQRLQANRQRFWKARGPTLVNEAHTEQIEQVNLVLAAEGCQLDAYQSLKRNQAERAHFNSLSDIRTRSLFALLDEFAREHNMNGVPRAAVRLVKKQILSRVMAVDESGPFHRRLRSWKVCPTDQDVYILCISDGRLIDRCDPSRDRVSADQRIGNGIRFQCRTGFQKALPNLFDGIDHPFQEESGTGNRRWHTKVYAKTWHHIRVVATSAYGP